MNGEFRLLSRLLASQALELLLSRYLTRNEASLGCLRALTGKVIALRVEPFSLSVYLIPNPGGMQIQTEFSGTPDLSVSGTPLALKQLAAHDADTKKLIAAGVSISGDTAIARLMQQLFRSSELDWESVLASIAGPAAARQLFTHLGDVGAWGRGATETLKTDLAEFLQEEQRDLPAAPESDAFNFEVDRLRDDCDRLEARISRLGSLCNAGPASLDRPGG